MKKNISLEQLFDTVRLKKTEQSPFVVYTIPNSKKVNFKSGPCFNEKYSNISKHSFFFMPFNLQNNGFLMLPDLSLSAKLLNSFKTKKPEKSKKKFFNEEEKKQYINVIESILKKIKKGSLKKVVYSKKFSFKLKSSNYLKIFENLISLYSNAFCYLFYHPSEGFWLGASPELLFTKHNSDFETVALAGTKFNSIGEWGKKEIEEQQIVSAEIKENLSPLCESIELRKTITVKAGPVEHLKSIIVGKSNASISKIIKALFPTSAIAGHPRPVALKLISEIEEHDRSFYSGFLGFNEPNLFSSYVNLRCLNLNSDKASIYVGSGITIDSNAEDEWQELIKKSETMLNALNL